MVSSVFYSNFDVIRFDRLKVNSIFQKKWYFVGTFINDTYAVVLIKAIAFSYSRENRWREMSKYQQQRNETIRNRKTTTIR